MQHQPGGGTEPTAEELLHDLARLRASFSEVREELAAIRRQRDDAIAQVRQLIRRVAAQDQEIAQLRSDVSAVQAATAAPSANPAPPAESDLDASIEVADDTSPQAEVPQSVVAAGAPDPVAVAAAEHAVVAAPAAVTTPEDDVDDATSPVSVELVGEPVAEPVAADDTGEESAAVDDEPAVAAPAARWLPPEESWVSSSAHEFAALQAPTAEEIAAEEAEAEKPRVAVDVLPAVVEERKPSLLRRLR